MSSPYKPNPRKYNKRNFKDLLDIITPEVYKTEDVSLSGRGIGYVDQIINTHVKIARDIDSILPVSALPGTELENINNISGISNYFIKQYEKTKVTPFSIETKILLPLGKSLVDFQSEGEFREYLNDTLLPLIRTATDTDSSVLESNIGTLSAYTGSTDTSSVHLYLANNLGWFYFLNNHNPSLNAYSPIPNIGLELSKVFNGETLETVDGVKALIRFLWFNSCLVFGSLNNFSEYLPDDFSPSTTTNILEASEYVNSSGAEDIRDNLNTYLDVVYSPYNIDKQDFRVRDALFDFINQEVFIEDTEPLGPFTKFQEAMGYSMADVTEQIENIGLIYDINSVPEEYIQYVSELIGWKLKGSFPSKWRNQLRNAVEIYKRKGTLSAIQTAINSLITDTIIDVSGTAQELWESYLPHTIWYSLGTESPFFENLTTWTIEKSQEAGLFVYDTTSLENNLKMSTDLILLNLFKKYPNNFNFNGETWPVNELYNVSLEGEIGDRYTIPYEPGAKDFFVLKPTDPGYTVIRKLAFARGEQAAWEESFGVGVLGEGNYFAGLDFVEGEFPKYLKPVGDPSFVFNFRKHKNFPIPPFEEIKYYKDCSLTPNLAKEVKRQLRCFGVSEDFATKVYDFIINAINFEDTNLNSLNNEFLFFFSGVQYPPNYTAVVSSIGEYENNLLPLWNGKSSHLFIDFEESDFDFANTTIEGEGKYTLINTANIAKEFAPGHAIVRTNFNLSAEDSYPIENVEKNLVTLSPKEIGYIEYTTTSGNKYSETAILRGYEVSGSDVFVKDGRGGLPTFKRAEADDAKDKPFFSSVDTLELPSTTVARTNLRRRNYRGLLPLEGYYDRTGFNGPVTFEAAVSENSDDDNLNVLTLGYVPSSGDFYPVVDPVDPSGVWDYCENLDSSRQFFGVDTSNTFPFRGLNAIGSDAKYDSIDSTPDSYVDRGQLPDIIALMHKTFERKAVKEAEETVLDNSSFTQNKDWKDIVRSQANAAIASGLVINSFSDYENFRFGKGMHKLYSNYKKEFGSHPINKVDETGGSILAHISGNGIYNCNLAINGSNSETAEGNYISNTLASAISIASNDGSGIFSEYGVDNYGTYIASSTGDVVVPINSSFVEGNPFNAEFRNPSILSGIEFVDVSGASPNNKFSIFEIPELSTNNSFLADNRVIKAKTVNGFPRLRFDLSSYGSRENLFVKDHDFEFRVNAYIGDETNYQLGGGSVGVWIHTEPVNNMFWSWTPNNKWEMSYESDLNISKVKKELSHKFTFPITVPPTPDQEKCLNSLVGDTKDSNTSIGNGKEEYLQQITVPFDTRNYTIFNNYKSSISVPEEFYKIQEQVHGQDTNYIIEVWFDKPASDTKFLLIDSFELQDITLRKWAGVPTGYGLETSSRPNLQFVDEDTLEFTIEEVRDTIRFFNGLVASNKAAADSKKYYNVIASRTPDDTAEYLEVSGGSRLNYRASPYWHEHEKSDIDTDSNNATNFTFQVSSITFIN